MQGPLKPLLLGCVKGEGHLVCLSLLVAVTWPLPAQCSQNCYDMGHKRAGFLHTALAGSSSKACRESQPVVQEPLLTQNSEFYPSLAVVLYGVFPLFTPPSMLIFSSARCKTLWDLPALRTGMIFPSQLPGVAFQPLACHCKVSCCSLMPHISFKLVGCFWTTQAVNSCPAWTIITLPASLICVAHSRQIK